MQVQFSHLMPSFAVSNKNHSTPLRNNSAFLAKTNLQNDIFVKSQNISFKGTVEDDLMDALVAIGIVGAPILLSIAAATYMAKNQHPEELFTYDGMYIGNVNDFKVKTDKVLADGDDGIFKVKGTGINIDASKYDVADIEKGVFKNYDGSVDIDLLNNKYIDKVNGIFIDPDAKVSALKIGNELVNVNLPAFGSGYSMVPWDQWGGGSSSSYTPDVPHKEALPKEVPYTRSEYINAFKEKPEDFPENIPNDVVIVPDRPLSERIQDFFTGKSEEKYDIFGRRFFNYTDLNGKNQCTVLDNSTYDLIKEHKIDGEDIPKIAEFINDLKLDKYIDVNYPEFADMITPSISGVEDFLSTIAESKGSGLGEALMEHVDDDTKAKIIETIKENIPEGSGHTVLDVIRDIWHDLIS